ncbi:MAG: hypothetical protein ACRDU8_04400 [Egibacteraceae bacterium]
MAVTVAPARGAKVVETGSSGFDQSDQPDLRAGGRGELGLSAGLGRRGGQAGVGVGCLARRRIGLVVDALLG